MIPVLFVIVISAVALSLYVAPFLPIVVALVTKANAPPALKAVLLLFLSAVTAVVTPLIQNGGSLTIDKPFAIGFATTFVVAVASYYGLTKPLGLAGSESKVAAVNNGRFALGSDQGHAGAADPK